MATRRRRARTLPNIVKAYRPLLHTVRVSLVPLGSPSASGPAELDVKWGWRDGTAGPTKIKPDEFHELLNAADRLSTALDALTEQRTRIAMLEQMVVAFDNSTTGPVPLNQDQRAMLAELLQPECDC